MVACSGGWVGASHPEAHSSGGARADTPRKWPVTRTVVSLDVKTRTHCTALFQPTFPSRHTRPSAWQYLTRAQLHFRLMAFLGLRGRLYPRSFASVGCFGHVANSSVRIVFLNRVPSSLTASTRTPRTMLCALLLRPWRGWGGHGGGGCASCVWRAGCRRHQVAPCSSPAPTIAIRG